MVGAFPPCPSGLVLPFCWADCVDRHRVGGQDRSLKASDKRTTQDVDARIWNEALCNSSITDIPNEHLAVCPHVCLFFGRRFLRFAIRTRTHASSKRPRLSITFNAMTSDDNDDKPFNVLSFSRSSSCRCLPPWWTALPHHSHS